MDITQGAREIELDEKIPSARWLHGGKENQPLHYSVLNVLRERTHFPV